MPRVRNNKNNTEQLKYILLFLPEECKSNQRQISFVVENEILEIVKTIK